MIETLELSLLGLDEDFPNEVYVLHHPNSDRYGCFCHEGVHGLACFRSEKGAFRFAEWIDLSGMITKELSFDEAREVAKERPLPVISVMLLDNPDDPQIHYIR